MRWRDADLLWQPGDRPSHRLPERAALVGWLAPEIAGEWVK